MRVQYELQYEHNNAFNPNTEINTADDIEEAAETFMKKIKDAAQMAALGDAIHLRNVRSSIILSPKAVGLFNSRETSPA